MSHRLYKVSASVSVLNESNEILLIKNPLRGWEIPGGHVDEGESIAIAAVREVREETGLDIEITRFCEVYHNFEAGIINFLFAGKVIGGIIQTSEESLEVGFYPLTDIEHMVTWKNFKERIYASLNNSKQPTLIEFGYKIQ